MLWTYWIYLFYGGWLLDIFSINGHIQYLSHSGFYPSTFLQPVNGSKISILNWVLKLNLPVYSSFFVCLSRKTLDRFFQILTKQTGLTKQFLIPRKHFCSCVQKIKNKYDVGVDNVFFFCFRMLLII